MAPGRVAVLLSLSLALGSGCAPFATPTRAGLRPVSAAHAPWPTFPAARAHLDGSGEREGHLLGDVTVYGLCPAPMSYAVKHETLVQVIDMLGGFPPLEPTGRRTVVEVRRCPRDDLEPGHGYAFTLHGVRRREALVLVAKVAGKRIVVAANVEGSVDVDVRDASPDALLRLLAEAGGLVIVAQAEPPGAGPAW